MARVPNFGTQKEPPSQDAPPNRPLPSPTPALPFVVPRSEVRTLVAGSCKRKARRRSLRGSRGPAAAQGGAAGGSAAVGGHSGLRHRLHPSPLCAFTRSPFSAPGSAQAHGKSATELLRVTLKPAPSRAGLHDPRSAAPQRPPPFSSPSRRLTPSGRPR